MIPRLRQFASLQTSIRRIQNTRHLNVRCSYSCTTAQEGQQPFDSTNFEDPLHEYINPKHKWLVGGWLLLCAAGVYSMVLLGGYTRLTHSGLSMTKWKPVEYHYPSNEVEWEKEFDHYKEHPEYKHTPCSLEKFKKIYRVEYLHRVSGSTLGLVFVAPLVGFKLAGSLKPKFAKRLYLAGGLGLAQGLIGWWMVKSGLNQPQPTYQAKPRVSTYRLMTHLSMALSIYSILVWNAATILKRPQHGLLNPGNYKAVMKMRGMSIGLIHLVAINLITGATMAGIDAGKVYNTWPLMNGAVVPDGITKSTPFWKNFFENNAMVQFNHRNAAYLTYAVTSFMTVQAFKSKLPKQSRYLMYTLFAIVNYQLLTGIVALLNQVQVHSGSIHQFNALNVLTVSLLLCHSLRKPNSAFQNYIKKFI